MAVPTSPGALSAHMLAVPLRMTDRVHFTPPLRLYIQTVYQADATKFESDLAAFDTLRTEMATGGSAEAYQRCESGCSDSERRSAVRWVWHLALPHLTHGRRSHDGTDLLSVAAGIAGTCSNSTVSPKNSSSTKRAYVDSGRGEGKGGGAWRGRRAVSVATANGCVTVSVLRPAV